MKAGRGAAGIVLTVVRWLSRGRGLMTISVRGGQWVVWDVRDKKSPHVVIETPSILELFRTIMGTPKDPDTRGR